jgi:hypothetical protein
MRPERFVGWLVLEVAAVGQREKDDTTTDSHHHSRPPYPWLEALSSSLLCANQLDKDDKGK